MTDTYSDGTPVLMVQENDPHDPLFGDAVLERKLAERDATILSLTRKLEELEKGKWQDISTAPKDGGFEPFGYEVLTWDGDTVRVAEHFADDLWITSGQPGHTPTHWQPLPSPPQIMEEGK
jgi:hypothetical protein